MKASQCYVGHRLVSDLFAGTSISWSPVLPFGSQQVLNIDMTSRNISLHHFISLTWKSTLWILRTRSHEWLRNSLYFVLIQLLCVADWFVLSMGTVFYSFCCTFCLSSLVGQAVGRWGTSMGCLNVSMSSVQYLLFTTQHLLKINCALREVCICARVCNQGLGPALLLTQGKACQASSRPWSYHSQKVPWKNACWLVLGRGERYVESRL